jgi:hypothetical protein
MKILTALGLSAALLLSALAGAVIVGNATAEESKTYYACANKNTGVLRLVKLRTKCKAGETRVVWGAVTPTPTPTPTPRPIPRSTPAPTVTCDFSQSGIFAGEGEIFIGQCAIPWTGLSRIVWSATVTLDLRPFILVEGDGEVEANYDYAWFAPALESVAVENCLPDCEAGFWVRNMNVTNAMCAVLSACTVTASNLVELIGNQTGDKVRLRFFAIPTRSYSISGTFTITKE